MIRKIFVILKIKKYKKHIDQLNLVDINIAGIATIKVNVENKYANVQKIYQYLCDKSSYLESVFDSMTSIDLLSDIDTIDKKIVYYYEYFDRHIQEFNSFEKSYKQLLGDICMFKEDMSVLEEYDKSSCEIINIWEKIITKYINIKTISFKFTFKET